MGKKRILDRISDALGLYDPDEAELAPEELEEAEEQEIREEKRKPSFPRVTRPLGGTEKEPAVLPVERAEERPAAKKGGLLSRVRKNKPENRTIQMKALTEVRVVVMEPTDFGTDSAKIAEYLRREQPVVINFETTDAMTKRRLTDFISGTIYALNGTIRNIGPNILVCAPRNVDVDAEAELYGGERREPSWPRN